MNNKSMSWGQRFGISILATGLGAMLGLGSPAIQAATPAKARVVEVAKPSASMPCTSTEMAPVVNVTVGKSTLLRLQQPVTRILLGNPEGGRAVKPQPVPTEKSSAADQKNVAPAAAVADGVADIDVILLSPREIYLLGKTVGSTNIVLLSKSGPCTLLDIAVTVDTVTLKSRLNELLPGNAIQVSAAAESVVLSGTVADAVKAERAVAIANAYAGKTANRVVNMLAVDAPQQVMLEVKVAEISKTLADKLGASLGVQHTSGNWTYTLLSRFLSSSSGVIDGFKNTNGNFFTLDAERKNGLVKILAEPNIMAISGQEGAFLAGGRIFIPVAQSNGTGATTITLEEKEFGIGLKFTPTVLEGGLINLKVRPEVSEVSGTGIALTAAGVTGTAILPVITTRRAETTLQLYDGQSFAIGGLIKNNVTQTIKAFPVLGEIPILGALFRSSDFQTDKSELVFVVTPHLVKPLPPDYKLPTDSFIEPSRGEFFLGGKMEGSKPPSSEPAPQVPPADGKAPTGFDTK